MTERPKLTQLDLWGRHEARILSVVREALQLLVRDVDDDEVALNRKLYFCLLEANRNRLDRGEEGFDYPPEYEGRNPPTPDTAGTTAEKKVPDFAWRYLDHSVDDPANSSRDFHIECKRLGNALPSGWNLNAKYVENGIVRFKSAAFRYGKDVESGAMVGYVESSTVAAALSHVNVAADTWAVARLAPTAVAAPVHEFASDLTRTFSFRRFRLLHLWVDVI